MLSPDWTVVRLFLHVLAATVWVGGQLTLAGLVPGLRAISPDAPRAVARAFAVRLAWPAFVVLLGTGVWNIVAQDPSAQGHAWRVTLWVKLGVVALSGVSAWLHSRASTRRGLAGWGAMTGVTALGALWLGLLLAT